MFSYAVSIPPGCVTAGTWAAFLNFSRVKGVDMNGTDRIIRITGRTAAQVQRQIDEANLEAEANALLDVAEAIGDIFVLSREIEERLSREW